MKRITKGFILFSLLWTIVACQQNKSKFQVDLSDVPEENVHIQRYGQALFSMDQSDIRGGLIKLQKQYEVFLGPYDFDESQVQRIADFIQDPRLQDLYDSTLVHFPNLDQQSHELTQAFRYLRYYFPEEKLPSFYSYVSDVTYEEPIMIGNDIVVIGLDNYLGKNFELYKQLTIPLYVSERMTPAYLTRDVMDAEVKRKHLEDDHITVVLDEMIRQGKRYSFIQHMIPNEKEAVIFGFSPKKVKWVNDNLAYLWGYFIENKILYSHEQNVFRTYVGDGPYCKVFGEESPANIGGYLGWQIINAYIQEHPEVPFVDLLKMNANDILRGSKFKP